jgi:Tol biopolymer transport system component
MKRSAWLGALCALAWSTAARPISAPDAPSDSVAVPVSAERALQAYESFRTRALLAWSATGRELLVRAPSKEGAAMELVASPGAPPQALTDAATDVTRARFEPVQGRFIVFAKATSPRLFRYDVATRELGAVSASAERAGDFAFDARGTRLAYLAFPDGTGGAPARTQVHVVDPRRAATDRVVARLEGSRWRDVAFSEDGKRLVVVEDSAKGGSAIWTIDIARGAARRITPTTKDVAYGAVRFSRDGRGVFTTSNRASAIQRLVLVDVASGRERVLSGQHAHPVDAFDVSHAVSKVAFITRENGSHVLRFLDSVTLKEQPRPSLFEGVMGGLQWRAQSGELGLDVASARTAGDVFSYDVRENRFTRWTNGNNPDVNTSEFPEPRIVRWKDAASREHTALHYPPPPRFTGKRPAIVVLEEAPGEEVRAGFRGVDNYFLVELGIAMIYPNLGRGRGLEDMGAVLDWIGTQADLDAERVMVVGRGPGLAAARAATDAYGTRLARNNPEAAAGAPLLEAVRRTLLR